MLPDRGAVTMTVPFMRAYTELLVAHLPPARRARDGRDGRVHPEPARSRGERDGAREGARGQGARGRDGFDGTWVAHPDLVPTATAAFDAVLGEPAEPGRAAARRTSRPGARACSRSRRRRARSLDGGPAPERLASASAISTRGCAGTGAVAIDNLMEDAATAEISRSQVWQWVRHGRVTRAAALARGRAHAAGPEVAAALFEEVALGEELPGVPHAARVRPPTMSLVATETKADDIALSLEEAIVTGEIAPGHGPAAGKALGAVRRQPHADPRGAAAAERGLGSSRSCPTGACGCGRSRARSCTRRSSSAPSSRPRDRARRAAVHRQRPRAARGGRAPVHRADRLRCRGGRAPTRSCRAEWMRANHAFHDVIYARRRRALRRAGREERAPGLHGPGGVGGGRRDRRRSTRATTSSTGRSARRSRREASRGRGRSRGSTSSTRASCCWRSWSRWPRGAAAAPAPSSGRAVPALSKSTSTASPS